MATGEHWDAGRIPDLESRITIVTGGNSGIGFHTALELARAGATVVLACRSLDKARAAADAMRESHDRGRLEVMALDLSCLASVRSFAAAFLERFDALHALCNNAGVMALPRSETVDGFELQLGTNHLGHFALTGLLAERLLATPGARVVTVSSVAHNIGRIAFDDLQMTRRYGRWRAYGRSKLANLLFAYELQRRLEAHSAPVSSLASHPGYAATNLQVSSAQLEGSRLREGIFDFANSLLAQSAEMGALPSLYALTAEEARGGQFIGPSGVGGMWGHPRPVRSHPRANDSELARRFWAVSEELTGVPFLSR